MKSVFRTAVEVDELVERNPCRINNASRRPKQQSRPDRVVRSVTHDTIRELADLVQPRDRSLVLLLAYCCIRSGEACALRRADLQLGTGKDGTPFGWLTIERGVSSYDGQRHEGDTKTGELGERSTCPSRRTSLPTLLTTWRGGRRQVDRVCCFPRQTQQCSSAPRSKSTAMPRSTAKTARSRKKGYGWYDARQVIGMPTLHLHWLRHWASTVWDEAGAPEGLSSGHHGPRPAGHDRSLHPP